LRNINGELRLPENSFTQPPGTVYAQERSLNTRGIIGKVYPVTAGEFVIEPPLNLGNSKPEDKFNVSLGTFNPSLDNEEI
jgi:hypothetical protein